MSAASTSTSRPQHLVVGAGVFGTSTALALVQAGHSVTVLDRSIDGFVAPDAASSDLNKIIRADYTDPFYRALGKEAISEWRTNPLYAPYYHETGVLFHSGHDNPAAANYMTQGVKNGSAPEDAHLEKPATGNQLPRIAHLIQNPQEGQSCFPEPLRRQLGPFSKKLGAEYPSYFNPRGGWAEARNATVAALAEAKRLGATVVGKAEVAELLTEGSGSVVTGVKTNDGRTFHASGGGSVIICAGSWTTKLLDSKLLPALKLGSLGEPASTSGQTVITVKLDEQQRRAFRGAPVTFNLKTGFYTFEPDAEGVLKAAIHGPGYANPAPPLDVPAASIAYPSFPSSASAASPASPPQEASRAQTMAGRNAPFEPTIQTARDEHIPANKEGDMFKQLLEVYPELENTAGTLRSRVCWYSDTADENWIIDAMPLKNLIVATGDSGHGFKFLPTIGKLILGRLPDGQRPASIPPLTPYQARVFSLEHHARLQKQAELQRKAQKLGGSAAANARARL